MWAEGEGTHVSRLEVATLIVGGGPTGLLMAYLLSKLGGISTVHSAAYDSVEIIPDDEIVHSLVAEKYPVRLASPKAHALSPRSLEICRQFGIDTTALRRLGTPREQAFWVNFCTTLSDDRIGRLPYERMDAEVLECTPEMIHNIPQPEFEAFLAQELKSDSNVEIRKGLAFVSCTQDDAGVSSILEESATGRRLHVRSQHVVGCDGTKSAVRHCLGINCEGEGSAESMMTIHFQADINPVLGEHVGMLHWCTDPAVSGFIIGYNTKSDMVLISSFDPVKRPAHEWTLDDGKNAVLAAIGRVIPVEVLSCRPWILSRQVAQTYRKDRVFLAGDAAHAFPPTGGLGLNCGLNDVHNLAWKLALFQQGKIHDTFLNTYELERRPVALRYARQSAENGKTIFSFLKKLGIAGIDELDAARANLYRTVRDPSKQPEIDEGIQGQREHFDNLGLHIGYVYGRPEKPRCISTYIPSYEPGARLPHVWITCPPTSVSHLPLDLSYVKEFTWTQRNARRYSILDLCAPGAFTLLRKRSHAQARYLESQVAGFDVKVNVYTEGTDFDFAISRPVDWQDDVALLIRPDQHILACLEGQVCEKELERAVLQHLESLMTSKPYAVDHVHDGARAPQVI